MSDDGPARFAGHFLCPVHGKETHPSRWAARHAARNVHSKGLREYPCTAYAGYWHNGHLPPHVRRGEYTVDEWFALPHSVRRQLWREEDGRAEPPA